MARITVVDRGAGIDHDQLERIFDKFVRIREGTVTGTGLGLYISRRIVEDHGGRIWAESGHGEETRFVVELPCTSADLAGADTLRQGLPTERRSP